MVLCVRLYSYLVFLFFKQKTAYEVRISDWSSDVCSSDLRCASRLRQHDRIEMLVRLFGDMDDVFITPFRAEVVDTDAAGLVAPIQVLQGDDQLGACRYLLFRRHCILKIEENMIGGGKIGRAHV